MSSNFEKVFFIVIFALSSRISQVCCLSTRTKSPCDALSLDSPGGDCNDLPNKETWVDNDCPRYQYAKHGTCFDIIGNGRIYMNKATQVSVERKLNATFQQLLTLISWLQDWTLDDVVQFADVTRKTLTPLQKQAIKYFIGHPEKMTVCSEKARKAFCLYHFPTCITYKFNNIVSVRKKLLCRDACLKLKQEICVEAYKLLSVFDQDIMQMYALDCNVLPKKSSDKCIQPAFLIPDPTVHTTANSSVTTSSKIYTSNDGSTAKSAVLPTTEIRSTATSTMKRITTINKTLQTTGSDPPTTTRSSAKPVKTSTSKHESTTKSTATIATEGPSTASSTTKFISTTNRTCQTTDQQQNNTTHSTSSSKEPSALQAEQDSKQGVSKNWIIYGLGCGAGLILCLVLIGILYLRKRNRRTKSQNEEVQEEEPYHICPFDDAEEIGHLMRSGQEGSSDTESLEMQMPPPIPDSVRPNIENITLLVGP